MAAFPSRAAVTIRRFRSGRTSNFVADWESSRRENTPLRGWQKLRRHRRKKPIGADRSFFAVIPGLFKDPHHVRACAKTAHRDVRVRYSADSDRAAAARSAVGLGAVTVV